MVVLLGILTVSIANTDTSHAKVWKVPSVKRTEEALIGLLLIGSSEENNREKGGSKVKVIEAGRKVSRILKAAWEEKH